MLSGRGRGGARGAVHLGQCEHGRARKVGHNKEIRRTSGRSLFVVVVGSVCGGGGGGAKGLSNESINHLVVLVWLSRWHSQRQRSEQTGNHNETNGETNLFCAGSERSFVCLFVCGSGLSAKVRRKVANCLRTC